MPLAVALVIGVTYSILPVGLSALDQATLVQSVLGGVICNVVGGATRLPHADRRTAARLGAIGSI